MTPPHNSPLLSRHVRLRLLLVLPFLSLLFSLLPSSRAMIDTNVTFQLSASQSTSDLEYQPLDPPRFTFSSSGSFFLSVTLNPPPPTSPPPPPSNYSVQVLFCSSAALTRLDVLSLQGIPIRRFCPDWSLSLSDTGCEWRVLLGDNTQRPSTFNQWSASVTSADVELTDDEYTLFIMNCGAWVDSDNFHYAGNDVSGHFTLIAQSRPGEYLSLTLVPFKSLYAISSVLWLLLMTVWLAHCWQWRWFNIKLQLALLAVPVSRAWLGVPNTAKYVYASRHGVVSEQWEWAAWLSDLVDLVVCFTVLILIAKGWRVLHAELTVRWKKQYVMYMALLVSASVMYKFGQPNLTMTLKVVAYLLLFQYIFTSVMANTLTIVNTVQAFRQLHSVDVTALPLWSKLHMYKLYQLALVLYFSISLITWLCGSLFLKPLPWVSTAVHQLLALLLGVAIMHGLCLRPFNPYWYWITMLYAQRGEQGGDAGLGASHSASVRAQDEHGSERRGRSSRRSSVERGEQRERTSRRSSVERGDQYDRMRESAGRRALRQQNQDMHASLLSNDYLDFPDRPPSPSLSDADPTASPSSLLWQPGMPVPAFPADPKQWLVTAEEEDAPLLVVHQPDGSIVLGQYASDVPCKVAIPEEALRYFPDDLVDMLLEADEAEGKDGEEADHYDERARRGRRQANGRERENERHTGAAAFSGGAGSGGDEERMATSSPAVRRVSSPSQFSISSTSRHRASDAPHSVSDDSSESDTWRGADDEDATGGGRGNELSRAVSMQQLGDGDKSGVGAELEEKKDGDGGVGLGGGSRQL